MRRGHHLPLKQHFVRAARTKSSLEHESGCLRIYRAIRGKSDNCGIWESGRLSANRLPVLLYFSGPSVPVARPLEEGAEPGRFRLHSSSTRPIPLPEERRYSPERAYRPRVSPPSVEDRDACAIYASVRKDATPSREPVDVALASLQKMLHRAGNVDGEGDGCGLLVDLPRKIWAEEVRSGGHSPALALDPAFGVGQVFIERSQDLGGALHGAREILGQGGFRILAERVGAVDPAALGATAREEEPYFWQVAGLVAEPERRDRVLFDLAIELEQRLGFHVASFSPTTCVYKVMGAPKVLGSYFSDLSDERFETVGCFGHNRYSTNTWPSFKRVQPFSVLGHNGEINTIEQLRQEARMLGVPVQPGNSDSQDLNRVVETLINRRGLSLAEAMELVVPPIVDEIRDLPA